MIAYPKYSKIDYFTWTGYKEDTIWPGFTDQLIIDEKLQFIDDLLLIDRGRNFTKVKPGEVVTRDCSGDMNVMSREAFITSYEIID